jgi:hypothetical protein
MAQELGTPVYQSVGSKGKTIAIKSDTMEEYVKGMAEDKVWVQGTLDTLFGQQLDTVHHRTPPYTTVIRRTPTHTTSHWIHHHLRTTTHHRTPPYTTVHHRTPP